MPQGKIRTKISVPSASKKIKINKKSKIIRKGARKIAPKKVRHIETAALNKTIQKAVDQHIEKEIILQAVKNNVPLTLLKPDKEDKSKKSTAVNKATTVKKDV